jgi:lactam utilization protein B
MIQKEEYKQARKTVNEYEKQLNLSVVSGSTCWIMHRTTDNFIFVTTDEEYANRQYESGDYTLRQSQIFDPM